ncbi:phospholipid-transporting ATPase ABCA1-like [Macrosteles quadrilineatus]|uniref:phospholipid-transporting ATPase ABCA1-like n=1 Tax=Macrosteles quadrilineatus TaxID=74068 RepID=UPI0023E18BE6|nr:phospholipid-transporting ATPase ABCA1-like [Macrosteles quadrilineatus]
MMIILIYIEDMVSSGNQVKSNEISLKSHYSFFFARLTHLEVAYAPQNNISRGIIENVVQQIKNLSPISIRKESKTTESELDQWLRSRSVNYSSDLFERDIGIVFSSIDPPRDIYRYKIRTTDPTMVTNTIDNDISTRNYPYAPVFLGTQMVLDQAILQNAKISNRLELFFSHLPSKEQDLFIVTNVLFVFLVFAYLFLLVSVIKDVVEEKECGTKELTKIMGVDSWMIWFHWFIYGMMVQLPVILVVTLIMTAWKPIFISAGGLVVFILFLLFTINLIVVLFAVSCLFYRTNVALTASLVGWFVLHLLLFIMVINKPENITSFMELILSLFPIPNLCWALSSLVSFQMYGEKWTWSCVFTQGYTKFKTSVGGSMVSFIVSTMLHTMLLIYLDAIYPGPYGVPKSYNFVYKWIRERLSEKDVLDYSEIVHESPENFEPVGENVKTGIALRGLRKIFGIYNKTVAVDKVDLDIYHGEIMVLLGHNGAGKTTTMSMITGMTAASKGVIMFEGENITVNKSKFRENLGLCPQKNLYFSKLTILEHLMFFGMLKGMSYSGSKKSGKSLLYSLSMLDKAETWGSKLSGGMQRRLCLAIALAGNPKVVILDEPTSGLDPQTRRSLWDVILRMRGERTVLITTHFMEEADVLGDRIAIMDRGRVVCCGTSLFLKKLFGTGYQIHVLKSHKAHVHNISNVVKQNIPNTHVKVVSKIQVNYITKEENVDKFPALFTALEKQKSSLHITAITVTCASLEDVFLKVASLPMGDVLNTEKSEQSVSKTFKMDEHERLQGIDLIRQQISALYEKRIIYVKRHIFSFLFKLCFILFVLISFAVFTQIERYTYEKQKELLINLRLYPNSLVLLAYDNQRFKGMVDIGVKIAQSLSGKVMVFSDTSALDDYLSKETTENNYEYVRKVLFALTFTDGFVVIRHHAGRKQHAPAIAINFLSNILLQNKTNRSGLIQAVNYPYVNTETKICNREKTNEVALEILIIYPYLILLSIGFTILLSELLSFIIEDRTTGFKHQQFLAGLSPTVYWFVNWTFDFCVYFTSAILILIIFSIFGPRITLMRFTWFCLLFLVFLLQGLAAIPLMYLYSFVFDSQGSSLAIYNVLMICLGVFPALLVSTGILMLFGLPIFILVVSVLCLNPVSATLLCLRFILKAIVLEEFCRVCKDELCPKDVSDVLRMPNKDDQSGILLYLIFLLCASLIYPLIVLLVDCGLISNIRMILTCGEADLSPPTDADEDVKRETLRVEAHKYENKDTPLRVEGLEKKYSRGPKAVDKVSFLVLKGECFGLLGVNGAGKSTTFKMLTAEVIPDRGDAFANSFSIKTDRRQYMTSVGYCPQHDAILPSLTGREILQIIAKIRGIPSSETKNAVETWLGMMGILEHAEKRCGSYSGGTKRKLGTAMALIGSPEVVFLDEPTTGVDPASRRKLWTVIKSLQKQGQAIVLTSHSMDECEALCTRLTIMVAGRMKCIGNVEYLKTRFGNGFSVLLKLGEHNPEDVELLKRDFDLLFPDNVVKDEHDTLIHYTILNPDILLSQLFSSLLQFKQDHQIVADFTASNTTLEELFLSFASNTQQRV